MWKAGLDGIVEFASHWGHVRDPIKVEECFQYPPYIDVLKRALFVGTDGK
jgi:hypothetical protein